MDFRWYWVTIGRTCSSWIGNIGQSSNLIRHVQSLIPDLSSSGYISLLNRSEDERITHTYSFDNPEIVIGVIQILDMVESTGNATIVSGGIGQSSISIDFVTGLGENLYIYYDVYGTHKSVA